MDKMLKFIKLDLKEDMQNAIDLLWYLRNNVFVLSESQQELMVKTSMLLKELKSKA